MQRAKDKAAAGFTPAGGGGILSLHIASNLPERPLRSMVLGGQLPNANGITIGLVGRGIASSLSPLMHESEGQRLGLDYRYHLIDFDRLGLDDDQLPTILGEARELGFSGLNITYPFKQAVLPLLDDLAPDAAAIGAVNTVVFEQDRSIGHNTDCWGFAESFRRGLPGVARGYVLQLGSGGAGAAVAQALLQCGAEHLAIYDTDLVKARALATRLQEQLGADVAVVDDVAGAAALAEGIVNATPVGMSKMPGLPIDAALILPRHWVADVVYFPLETALVQLAYSRGCDVLPGGGMAVYQAVRAFELFASIRPDAAAMAETFRVAVGR